MQIMKICTTVLAIFLAVAAFSQEEIGMPPIPDARAYHHEQIIRSMDMITKMGRRPDNLFPVTGNHQLDSAINHSIRIRINNLRAGVELNSGLGDNAKYKWLRSINEVLTGFISAYRTKTISATLLPALIGAYEDAMKAELAGNSILPVIAVNEPEVGNILMDNFGLKENEGLPAAREILVLKACQRNPENILKILTSYPNVRYADSLIIKAAFQNQEELYSFAAVPNALGRKIQSVDHPLVKMIGRLALMQTGRMYFPFIDNLYRKKITLDSIRPFVLNDSSGGYYKLLVKTRIDYAQRMQRGDTPMGVTTLTNRLRTKAVELYINEINALHDINNENIRFKKLEDLEPEELYYLAVLGEEEIYTSSFVTGVYPRIFRKMRIPRSDSLLMLLHDDYYKKFIKMCAAYNTLDNFLSRMERSSAESLMRRFVNGLETTKTLEDAVDVADSYASIYNSNIRRLMITQVQSNLRTNTRQKNKRGELIYDLLNTIFLSMDSVNKIDIAAKFDIDPVYKMPRRSLQDSSGRVIIQQFSYGDKDALNYFSAFLSRFNNANWRTLRKPNWVEISSVRGAPVTIYANLPLDEKKELDIQAQDSLISYLEENKLTPTIVIHRGHSYYLQETINRLPHGAKIVLLGSCGGYQKLNDILKICPAAQIISSKQVGAGVVNQSLIDAISDRLRSGKDINWEDLWKTVQVRVGAGYRDKFEDYIPPHKNLGAIFIIAYNKVAQRSIAQ